jgi:hypothetical protein
MCTDSVDKEKERFEYLLELINKTLCEGDKKVRKIFKEIVK